MFDGIELEIECFEGLTAIDAAIVARAATILCTYNKIADAWTLEQTEPIAKKLTSKGLPLDLFQVTKSPL